MFDWISPSTRAAGMQALVRSAGKLTRYIPLPQPTLLVGAGTSLKLAELVAGFGHHKVLIVCGQSASRSGVLKPIQEALNAGATQSVVFDQITPDAPIPLVERAIAFCEDEACDAVFAIGGGSPMDAAKAIAMGVNNGVPHQRSLRSLAGYLKGRLAPLPIYAIPTTAGTGSEVTIAAVIADPEKTQKLVIIDPRLVPKIAALDPELMLSVPPAVTAATGMDAFTHAVESYVSRWANEHTQGLSLMAVSLIFKHLRDCYQNGSNLAAREKMALASTYAGLAFTRANVGYVHAIAHQLGAKYHTPHGLANAMVLPVVLRYSLSSIAAQLAALSVRAGIGESNENEDTLAERFIAKVEQLNRDLNIPAVLAELKEADIPALAAAACQEAELNYPVPKSMSPKQCAALISKLLPTVSSPEKSPTKRTSARKKS